MLTRSRYATFSVRRHERKLRNRLIFSLIVSLVIIYLVLFWGVPTIIDQLSTLRGDSKITPKPASDSGLILAPPTFDLPFEATNSASIKLKGYSTPNSKVEIYLDDSLVDSAQAAENGSFQSKEIELNLGTNNFHGISTDERDNKSLPSKEIKLIFSSEKPPLSVLQPIDSQQFTQERKILISGKTDPSKGITVKVNDSRVILDAHGNWQDYLELKNGDNIITIEAKDSAGNLSQITRKVTFTPDTQPSSTSLTPTPRSP